MSSSLVIPYVIDEPKRSKTFTSAMEKAAVLCLAQVRGRKPKIIKGIPEEIGYIVKMQYPLWSVPWEDKCLITDGLGLSSAVVSHDQIPNVIEFVEDLKRSSDSLNLFQETLKRHIETFEDFSSTKKEIIEAAIGDSSILMSLSSLIAQAIAAKETPKDDVVMIPPKVSRDEAEKKAEKLVSGCREWRTEITALQYALDVLKEEEEYHKERISREIEQIWRDYEKRISDMKKPVEAAIKQLSQTKGEKTKSSLAVQEEKLNTIHKEEKKLEQPVEKLRQALERNQRKLEYLKRKYPKRNLKSLEVKINLYLERIKELTNKVHDFSKLEEKVHREGEDVLKKIEEKYQRMVGKEIEKLEILKESRNLEISRKREEMRDLEENVSKIESQIKQLIERKNNSLRELEESMLPLKLEETTLIGIQFYLVHYETPQKTRVDIYPPVTAMSYDGVIKKIQKAILSFSLEARIQLLLKPRSEALNDIVFENFKKHLETDSTLKEKVRQIGRPRNLLGLQSFKEEAAKGSKELEAEGWINEQEKKQHFEHL